MAETERCKRVFDDVEDEEGEVCEILPAVEDVARDGPAMN